MLILKRNHIVTVKLYYYLPDYSNLLNEFLWQTIDFVPEIPRVHKFLNYWKENVKATIQEVLVAYSLEDNIRKADFYEKLKIDAQ